MNELPICRFCKEQIKPEDRIMAGRRNEENLYYHFSCYDYWVMNFGSIEHIKAFNNTRHFFENKTLREWEPELCKKF